ncbi:hypothetical protein QAD02_002948 [Eretmocerus hayati]|uniref:Uncharacterized protein n=1 Tax=Eretmocerus hayati TaxID=131215 RepID=A0ACC2NMZ8_9HYME|nr:hypothetical protein QAD02_002948 [Eretmocerus hayati]
MKQYNSSKPPSYIISWDQNNLYGEGLSQPLPYAGLTWIENVADFDVRSIPDDGPCGYFVETNIKYPVELHELHSDYLFCPERLVPPNSSGRFGLESLISLPNFNKLTVFDGNLACVHLNHSVICLNKPIFIGITTLDVTKTLMCDFYYNYVLKFMRNPTNTHKVNMLYTDTDNFVLEIIGVNDIYIDIMKRDRYRIDTSNFPIDNCYGIEQANARVLAKMKDVYGSRIIREAVFICSTVYSMLLDSDESGEKALKGVKRIVVKNTISFYDFKSCLFDGEILYVNQNSIRHRCHKVFTVRERKLALRSFHDKRITLPDLITTRVYGDYRNVL